MIGPRSTRLYLAAALALAPFAPRDAEAEDARAAAQAIFDEAMRRMDERAYERACPGLEQVVKLAPGKVGALLELARCYEEWDKPASAWRWYRTAADVAGALSDPRAASARAKVEALWLRSPRLLVLVAPANQATPGFTVELDGRELGAARWATALPADPGSHVIAASAPGKKRWTESVALAPEGRTVSFGVPALPDADAPPPAPTPARDARAGERGPVWPWVAGGLGVASLLAGAGFGIDGLSARGTLVGLCHGTLSPCAGHTAGDLGPLDARKDRGLAMFVALGTAGVSGMAAGIAGLAARPKARSALVVTPVVGPRAVGAGLGGTF